MSERPEQDAEVGAAVDRPDAQADGDKAMVTERFPRRGSDPALTPPEPRNYTWPPVSDADTREAVLAGGLAPASELENLELELLLDGIYRHYGMDFRHYAMSSLRRRVWNMVRSERLATVTALLDRVLHDQAAMERFLLQLSVNVTSMFRDPGFWRSFRDQVVPLLRAVPFTRIWCAGCSTGEEVYSLAIILDEEGLYERSRIYATDMNEAVLRRATDGIYPIDAMQEYTGNYQRAGGREQFSRYYTARYDHAILKHNLRRNVIFSHHNLVTDGSFNEFNVVLCRNVMIYFDSTLQDRVHRLIHGSLRRFGLLALGRKESLAGTPHQHDYDELNAVERIYRKRA